MLGEKSHGREISRNSISGGRFKRRLPKWRGKKEVGLSGRNRIAFDPSQREGKWGPSRKQQTTGEKRNRSRARRAPYGNMGDVFRAPSGKYIGGGSIFLKLGW